MFKQIAFLFILISFQLGPISSLICKSCHTCKGGNFGLMEPRRNVACKRNQRFCIADVDVFPRITKTGSEKVVIKLGCSDICPKDHFCCTRNYCNNINKNYINKRIQQSIKKFSNSQTLVL